MFRLLGGKQKSTEVIGIIQADRHTIRGGLPVTYDEVLAQVLELLQRDKRVAYRVLKRRFGLDDEYVDDLKADLIKAKRLAVDEDGEVLVWTGGETKGEKLKGARDETESDSELRTPNSEPLSA